VYDEFSADYDRFVDWPARLAVELPFIEEQLRAGGARRVLDAACGTGMHAIALARSGYDVTGADLSAGMIARAQANATTAGVDARFEAAGFGELAVCLGTDYDAVLCLGNSLPHLPMLEGLAAALTDFATCLRPGGLLLIQNRNFDAVLARRERWMGPQSHREGDAEWLFLRFYDFEQDGTLVFNVVTLRRVADDEWSQQTQSTRLRPVQRNELMSALEAAGFDEIACWGDLRGTEFDPTTSGNLVVAARRQ
jgi:2-polyprenyl-3-methyl-5-hydroxy-6-metoxy-1,4-benzoquinol methylase